MAYPIWTDLPSVEVCKQRLLGSKKRWFGDNEYLPILKAIEYYHRFPKDQLGQLQSRISALERVAQECQRRSDNAQVAELKARASNKRLYLKTLLEHYFIHQDNPEVMDPFTMIQQLERQKIVPIAKPDPSGKWVSGGVGMNLIGLQGGGMGEKLDPFHREFEFQWDFQGMRKQNKMNTQGTERWKVGQNFFAFNTIPKKLPEWVRKVYEEQYREPFFVYLDSTSFCAEPDDPDMTLHMVHYNTPERPLSEVTMVTVDSDGKCWEHFGTGERKAFDTSHVKEGKGKADRAKAYNFTKGCELVVGQHKEGVIHHSSLTAGALIRCAGMVAAVQGKLTFINDNSGHYTPSPAQFYGMVKWLKAARAFADNATVGSFERGGNNIPIDAYLANPMRGSKLVMGGHRKR
jgi:hypothetical protein